MHVTSTSNMYPLSVHTRLWVKLQDQGPNPDCQTPVQTELPVIRTFGSPWHNPDTVLAFSGSQPVYDICISQISL